MTSNGIDEVLISPEEAQARWSFNQAQASSRLEGHVPDASYLADCEAVIKGTMTTEEAIEASRKRAVAENLLAARAGGA